ncbi:MAG: BtpA/SgcQ family protein [Bacteroidota bacterium]
MSTFTDLFPVSKPVIGMIHVHALPGTPGYAGDLNAIMDAALKDAATYQEAGIDGLMLENMHDIPYLKGEVGHEVSTTMAVVSYMIKKAFGMPCGIQILAGANEAAVAAAQAAGLDFVRAEGYVFGHVADEGWMDASAGPLLRYRRKIGADEVLVLTDIKKKHSAHALTADVDILETAKAAEFFASDGLIVTGTATGATADISELGRLKGATRLPVIVGSGVTATNLDQYFPLCDAFIVGSHFKVDGDWRKSVDYGRVKAFMDKARQLRRVLG